MRITRFIAITALYTALLISLQLALSGVVGVELVTAFFLAFCFTAGVKAGVTVAVCFSLLRCFLFGFSPSVIVLYLVYYSCFALFFGFLGNVFKRRFTFWSFFSAVVFVTVFTALFTLLDDVITPLFYGFDLKAMQGYFIASLPVIPVQCVCAALSSLALFFPLTKALLFALKIGEKREE